MSISLDEYVFISIENLLYHINKAIKSHNDIILEYAKPKNNVIFNINTSTNVTIPNILNNNHKEIQLTRIYIRKACKKFMMIIKCLITIYELLQKNEFILKR